LRLLIGVGEAYMTIYSRIYCVGIQNEQADCQAKFQVFVSSDPRPRFDVNYLDRSVTQLGAVRSIFPENSSDSRSLVDACIAFFPEQFRGCPSLRVVEKMLRQVRELDFQSKPTPPEWRRLRSEAEEAFKHLRIYEAPLRELSPQQILEHSPFSLKSAVRVAATWLRGAHHAPSHRLPTQQENGMLLPKPPTSPDPHSRRSA